MLRCPSVLLSAVLAFAFNSSAYADISLSGTRLVFKGDKKEASLTVRNMGSSEILVQSWLEGKDASTSIPFAITPPLARLDGNGRQILRVLFQGTGVPTDKESVYWLNVQEIPKVAEGENVLQIAIRQRIKLFYRPSGLQGEVADAPAKLKWQIVGQEKGSQLQVQNTGVFYVSMVDLKVNGTKPINLMVAPGETVMVALETTPKAGETLSFKSINDYGAKESYSAILSQQPVSTARVKSE